MVCGNEVCRWCVGVRLHCPDKSGKCWNLFKIKIIILKNLKANIFAEVQETTGKSWKWDDC